MGWVGARGLARFVPGPGWGGGNGGLGFARARVSDKRPGRCRWPRSDMAGPMPWVSDKWRGLHRLAWMAGVGFGCWPGALRPGVRQKPVVLDKQAGCGARRDGARCGQMGRQRRRGRFGVGAAGGFAGGHHMNITRTYQACNNCCGTHVRWSSYPSRRAASVSPTPPGKPPRSPAATARTRSCGLSCSAATPTAARSARAWSSE